MKFIHYLERISGVATYPLTSLLLFFGVFAVAIIVVLRLRKEDVNRWSEIPLRHDDDK